jgi:hypothetical protein
VGGLAKFGITVARIVTNQYSEVGMTSVVHRFLSGSIGGSDTIPTQRKQEDDIFARLIALTSIFRKHCSPPNIEKHSVKPVNDRITPSRKPTSFLTNSQRPPTIRAIPIAISEVFVSLETSTVSHLH